MLPGEALQTKGHSPRDTFPLGKALKRLSPFVNLTAPGLHLRAPVVSGNLDSLFHPIFLPQHDPPCVWGSVYTRSLTPNKVHVTHTHENINGSLPRSRS